MSMNDISSAIHNTCVSTSDDSEKQNMFFWNT